MKNIRTIVLSLLALTLLQACREDSLSGAGGENRECEVKISSTIEQRSAATTRASDSGFADGDAVGLYVVDYVNDEPSQLLPQGNHANNMRHTYNAASNSWKGTATIYWTDDRTAVDAYSYYPFRDVVENPQAMAVSLSARQDRQEENAAMSNYEASDFLWAKATKVMPGEIIRLNHYHLMAGVEVNLVPGLGFETGTWAGLDKSVIIEGMIPDATIDLHTGSVKTGGGERISIVPVTKPDGAFRAVVAPQTVAAGVTLLTVTVDGVSYSFKRESEMDFLSRKLHTFTIEVVKRLPEGDYEFKLIDESVKAWEDDGTSHSGTAREYVVVQSPQKGGLKAVLQTSGCDLNQLENLKIIGEMNPQDFADLKELVPNLEALNLQEVKLRDAEFKRSSDVREDDVLPNYAFYCCPKLKYIVFPKEMKKIGEYAFRGAGLCGALDIPEGMTHIGESAFNNWDAGEGAHMYLTSLSLPTTLEYIGGTAFRNQKFNCELVLPESLKEIGEEAFEECLYLHGQLNLPSGLEVLGNGAFAGLKNLTGPLVIPAGVKQIEGMAGIGCSSLVLPEGLEIIGDFAFGGSHLGGNLPMRGELYVPKTVKKIGREAFCGTQFSHAYLPEGITEVSVSLFGGCNKLIDTLSVPSTVKQIRAGAFNGCSRLTAILLPEGLESIGGDNQDSGWTPAVFDGCYALNLLRCDAKEPPTLIGDVFGDLPKNNFTIEVPAGSVEAYRNAEGWREFKRISPYSGFVCRPQFANLLNKGSKRDVVLNADGAWTVKQKPAWCNVSAMSGNKKTQLTVTIDDLPDGAGTRYDSIVFALDGKEFTACYYIRQYDSEYKEDASYTLQTAKRGKGIDVVLLGDGYDAGDIANGTCLSAMQETMEHFFGVEPYTAYRDYFNVYTAWAMSYESGIGSLNTLRDTKFKTEYGNFTHDSRIHCEADYTMQYAVENSPVTAQTLNKTLVILVPNCGVYDGVTYMYSDGSALAICPKSEMEYPNDARGLVQHEACGHGFGKLTDEYVYHRAWIQTCPCTCCAHASELLQDQSKGWGKNVSLKGRYNDVPWKHLIYDSRYNDIVDIYDGGFYHSNGVYRSEHNSVMNNNVPYFSTWSRQLIVERIKLLAGEKFDYEEFVASDSREWGRDFTAPGLSTRSQLEEAAQGALHGAHPVIINRSPNLHTRKK